MFDRFEGNALISAHTLAPVLTGRHLVAFPVGETRGGIESLTNSIGVRAADIASTADYADGGEALAEAAAGGSMVFEQLGIAVVATDPEQASILSDVGTFGSNIVASEPEHVEFALNGGFGGDPNLERPGVSAEQIRTALDAVTGFANSLLGRTERRPAPAAEFSSVLDTQLAQLTWGLAATKVGVSRFSGQGVRVAVLDTGMDLNHPDFQGRPIQSQSFIPGEAVQDGNGHGTHCIGTACGPRVPGVLPRYGCAFEAEIFAGKVLNNAGRGGDAGILAGIDWALRNGCRIISMSLGSPANPGTPPSPIYEQAGQRALNAGTLIIAAAGNESSRPAFIAPVGRPANCPSIFAVGAVDSALQVAAFSNGGINPSGGEVNIAGPGVGVYSSFPMLRRYAVLNGTSMAAPHVAGIAALWLQTNPGMSALQLAGQILSNARQIGLPARDGGRGLVQAP